MNSEFLIKKRPLSEKVKEKLLQYIKTMDLETSNKLPNENFLSALLGVSRITIRSAFNELASEGKIFRQKGRGTFVNVEALQIKVTFNPAVEFEDMIRNSGYKPCVEVVGTSIIHATAKEAALLQIDLGDEVVVIEKMYYADGNPAALCKDCVPKKYINEVIEQDEYVQSIFKLINLKCGKKVMWDKVELTTVSVLDEISLGKRFQAIDPKKTFLLCEAINYDESNKPIFVAYEYIDTNYIRFNIIRPKDVVYQ